MVSRKPLKRGQRSRLTMLVLLLSCTLSLCGLTAVFGASQAQSYTRIYQTARQQGQAGEQHLLSARRYMEQLMKNPFDPAQVRLARQEFAAAYNEFLPLSQTVSTLPNLIQAFPYYSAQVKATQHLIPLALILSQAGMQGCDLFTLFSSKFRQPLGEAGDKMVVTKADVSDWEDKLNAIGTLLDQAEEEVNQIQTQELQSKPNIVQMVEQLRSQMPELQNMVSQAQDLLPLLPQLIGIETPTNYLMVFMDNSELRPSGGFIGNYGIATFIGGRLSEAKITDVDLLDKPFLSAGKVIPFPEQYQWFGNALHLGSWNLRDANLEADFPTSARAILTNYQLEGGKSNVEGVIGMTPTLIQQLMRLTGPINIPEYRETVDADNLIERIHYHQLQVIEGPSYTASADGHSSMRKRFTAYLAEHFLEKIRQLPSDLYPQLCRQLLASLHAKDLQLYLSEEKAENILIQHQLAGTIPDLNQDGFLVVDTNVAGNKANILIQPSMKDKITLDATGNATHHTALTYFWQPGTHFYGNGSYKSYVRIYVPETAKLQKQNGWQENKTSQAYGRQVWSGYLTVQPGQTKTIELDWIQEHAAQQQAGKLYYQYDLQRQAGTRWNVRLDLILPDCVQESSNLQGWQQKSKRDFTMKQWLESDQSVHLSYRCE